MKLFLCSVNTIVITIKLKYIFAHINFYAQIIKVLINCLPIFFQLINNVNYYFYKWLNTVHYNFLQGIKNNVFIIKDIGNNN